MPDVTAACDRTVFLVVVGDLDAVQNALRGSDLVGTHDHQHIFRCEYTVFGQHVQEGVLGKEGARKVDQVGNHFVIRICPGGSKLKAVAGLLLFDLASGGFANGIEPRAVGVVFGVGPVGDYKDLYILV